MSDPSPGPVAQPLGDDKKIVPVEHKDLKTAKTSESAVSSDLSGSEDNDFDSKDPFNTPENIAHWKQVYEDASYECRHVFDPTLTWTEEEEKKIIRKLDWRVCLWAVSTSLLSMW